MGGRTLCATVAACLIPAAGLTPAAWLCMDLLRRTLEGLLGKGCARGGQILSLRLDVATPSPPPRRDEDEAFGEQDASSPESAGVGCMAAHVSPTAPPAFWSAPVAQPSGLNAASAAREAAFARDCRLHAHGVGVPAVPFLAPAAQAPKRGVLTRRLGGLTLGGGRESWNIASDVASRNPFLVNMQALKLTSDEGAPLHSFSSGLSASLRRDIEALADRRGAIISLRRGAPTHEPRAVDALATSIESWAGFSERGGDSGSVATAARWTGGAMQAATMASYGASM